MAEQARISDLQVLRDLKVALAKFAEEVGTTLSGVDADVQRVGQWLTHERPTYWKHEVRRQEDRVAQARAEIAKKQLSRAPEPASVVEERRAFQRAQRKLEIARERSEAVRKWAPVWERESQMYKASCSGLTETLQRDIPGGISRLERMAEALERYLSITQESAATDGPDAAAVADLPAGVSRHAVLRSFSPSAEERQATESAPIMNLTWMAGTPTQDDAEAITRLAAAEGPPGDEDSIVFAWRAVGCTSVVFTRLAVPPDGDSGWYIGPIDRAESTGGLRRTTVGSFRACFPGLAPLLVLKPGTVVVLTAGTVRAVVDAADREVWTADLI